MPCGQFDGGSRLLSPLENTAPNQLQPPQWIYRGLLASPHAPPLATASTLPLRTRDDNHMIDDKCSYPSSYGSHLISRRLPYGSSSLSANYLYSWSSILHVDMQVERQASKQTNTYACPSAPTHAHQRTNAALEDYFSFPGCRYVHGRSPHSILHACHPGPAKLCICASLFS